jgi:hypothetical protein
VLERARKLSPQQ